MDFLRRENVENAVSSHIGLKTADNFKRIKHIAKPLSDVKNILADKNCLSQHKNKKELLAEVYTKVQAKETGYELDPLCFFEDNPIDDYKDIIPLGMQLSDEDIKHLCLVLDGPHYPKKSLEPVIEYLPLPEVPFIEDELIFDFKNELDWSGDIFDI